MTETGDDRNLTRSVGHIDAEVRAGRNGHMGGVLWLTGLSGAGKSTVANAVEARLFDLGWQVCVLDGDNLRHGLCRDLSFSSEDRTENIRRAAEVASLFQQTGMMVITSFISPFQADRDQARQVIGESFSEVFINAGLDVCEARDPKGLYQRARAGEIPDFTGITSPYEAPEKPDLVLDTGGISVEDSTDRLVEHALERYSISNARL